MATVHPEMLLNENWQKKILKRRGMNKILLKDNFTAHCFAIIITLCSRINHNTILNWDLYSKNTNELLSKWKKHIWEKNEMKWKKNISLLSEMKESRWLCTCMHSKQSHKIKKDIFVCSTICYYIKCGSWICIE